jgi:hypothetical protein
MTIGLNLLLRNARLQVIKDALDLGADEYSASILQIYSGDRPGTGGEIDEYDSILVQFSFSNPCGEISDGVLTFLDIQNSVGLAYGEASWARAFNNNGDFVADFSVTDSLGVGDVKINSLIINEGDVIQCIAASLTEGNA